MPPIQELHLLPLTTRVLLTSAAALLSVLLCIFLLVGMRRILRVKHQREHTIELANQGNVRSYYQLWIEAPLAPLETSFLMNGIPLVETQVPVAVEPSQNVEKVAIRPLNIEKKSPQPKQPSLETSGTAQAAGKAGKSVISISGSIASLLGTLGSLLPGSLGNALKEQSAAARSVQTKATEGMRAPEAAKRKVGALQKEGEKLGVKKQADMPAVKNEISSAQSTHPAVEVATPSPSPQTIRNQQYKHRAQTGQVGPGERITLTLCLTWQKHNAPAGSIPYTLHSQQVPVDKFNREIPPISKQGVVFFHPAASWRYWIPNVISGLIIFVALVSFIYVMSFLWMG